MPGPADHVCPYQQNDMQVGDRVMFKGAYRRLDANHAMLDPCLANRAPE